MKGILKNTKAGWFVLYQVMRDELASGYDSIPLHPDSQTWMDGYNLYEGKEVLFELVMDKPEHRYSETPYAKTIDEEDLGCSYPDCICQGNEITDCENRTPKQRQTMSKVQTPDQVVLGYKTALVEGMNNLNKHSQQVDFSNSNADKITSGTTNKPTENKKQTPVDWLIEQLTPSISLQQKHIDDLKEKAKEMEKNQIINTFKDAQVFKVMNDETRAEQYYNQLYGK